MATVLEGFLVSLGFDVDKDQLAKFNGTIAEAQKRFVSIGKAAVGAGVALGAAFAKSTSEVNNLYKVSNNTGASINGLMILQGAVKRVGGSAENVTAAFGEFANKAKTLPGFADMIRNQLGVSLSDAAGRGRDMAEVFVDISKKIAKMAKTNPGLARMQAEAIGLGNIFDDIVKGDFPKELQRSARMAGLFGKEIDKGANSSHRLMNEISQVWDTVADGTMSATAQITEALHLDKKLETFNNGFADFLKSTIDSQVQIVKDASGFFDWVGKVLFKSGDYYDKSRAKVLADREKLGTATPEERKELSDLRQTKKENDVADRWRIDRDDARRLNLSEKQDDDTALKAEVLGIDLKQPGARESLENREITEEDIAELMEAGETTKVMLASELRKRQQEQKATEEPPAINLTAPIPEPPPAKAETPVITPPAINLTAPIPELPPAKVETPVTTPLAGYFDGAGAWQREAAAKTENTNVNNSRVSTTTVNQTINVNGAGNPRAVADSIVKETKSAVRNAGRNLV